MTEKDLDNMVAKHRTQSAKAKEKGFYGTMVDALDNRPLFWSTTIKDKRGWLFSRSVTLNINDPKQLKLAKENL